MAKPKVAPAQPIRQAVSVLPVKYDEIVMSIAEAEAGLRILQAIDNGDLQQVAKWRSAGDVEEIYSWWRKIAADAIERALGEAKQSAMAAWKKAKEAA
jgi:hypothetical protein